MVFKRINSFKKRSGPLVIKAKESQNIFKIVVNKSELFAFIYICFKKKLFITVQVKPTFRDFSRKIQKKTCNALLKYFPP